MIVEWANCCKSIKCIKMIYSKNLLNIVIIYLFLNYLFAVIYTETLPFCEHNFGMWSVICELWHNFWHNSTKLGTVVARQVSVLENVAKWDGNMHAFAQRISNKIQNGVAPVAAKIVCSSGT